MANILPELLEHQATGRIAGIYDEIRRFSGVPYVSSLQRYLATMPGVLEWAWDAVRPALASGTIQETAWRLAADVRISPPAPIPAAALAGADVPAIRNIAANFVRVSPVNLLTGACAALLLTGTKRHGAGFPTAWTPPTMLPPMPGNVDPATQPLLMRFATEIGGTPFVPALYRQIAHWPGMLAWLADELGPRFKAQETIQAGAAFRNACRAAAPAIAAQLPPPPPNPPDPATVQRVLEAIDRYAETSPEMTMFGQLILDALHG